jgi:hypothetical protein
MNFFVVVHGFPRQFISKWPSDPYHTNLNNDLISTTNWGEKPLLIP